MQMMDTIVKYFVLIDGVYAYICVMGEGAIAAEEYENLLSKCDVCLCFDEFQVWFEDGSHIIHNVEIGIMLCFRSQATNTSPRETNWYEPSRDFGTSF